MKVVFIVVLADCTEHFIKKSLFYIASGSPRKFVNRLFTVAVVRARQKNAGIVGLRRVFYAAMAAAAKINCLRTFGTTH